MKIALYARVSTSTHGQDVELQLRELRDYCQRRGWTVFSEYVDTISGSKDRRPELDRLMAGARRRRFDAVLCWKLDRFGRSLKHLVVTIAELESFGVAFISLTDNLDLSTAQGRLMFHVIAAMSEFERSLTQERVKAGLRNARAKGKVVGRPRVSVDAARIAGLRLQGRSWSDVCAETGLSAGVAKRAFYSLSKNPSEIEFVTA